MFDFDKSYQEARQQWIDTSESELAKLLCLAPIDRLFYLKLDKRRESYFGDLYPPHQEEFLRRLEEDAFTYGRIHEQKMLASLFFDETESVSSKAAKVIGLFDFPKDLDIDRGDRALRKAMYDVCGGTDFYTGLKLPDNKFSVDHVVPEDYRGPSNVYNYVVTAPRINSQKGNSFDAMAAARALCIVRTVYAPRVIRKLDIRPSRLSDDVEVGRVLTKHGSVISPTAIIRDYEDSGRSITFSAAVNMLRKARFDDGALPPHGFKRIVVRCDKPAPSQSVYVQDSLSSHKSLEDVAIAHMSGFGITVRSTEMV